MAAAAAAAAVAVRKVDPLQNSSRHNHSAPQLPSFSLKAQQTAYTPGGDVGDDSTSGSRLRTVLWSKRAGKWQAAQPQQAAADAAGEVLEEPPEATLLAAAEAALAEAQQPLGETGRPSTNSNGDNMQTLRDTTDEAGLANFSHTTVSSWWSLPGQTSSAVGPMAAGSQAYPHFGFEGPTLLTASSLHHTSSLGAPARAKPENKENKGGGGLSHRENTGKQQQAQALANQPKPLVNKKLRLKILNPLRPPRPAGAGTAAAATTASDDSEHVAQHDVRDGSGAEGTEDAAAAGCQGQQHSHNSQAAVTVKQPKHVTFAAVHSMHSTPKSADDAAAAPSVRHSRRQATKRVQQQAGAGTAAGGGSDRRFNQRSLTTRARATGKGRSSMLKDADKPSVLTPTNQPLLAAVLAAAAAAADVCLDELARGEGDAEAAATVAAAAAAGACEEVGGDAAAKLPQDQAPLLAAVLAAMAAEQSGLGSDADGADSAGAVEGATFTTTPEDIEVEDASLLLLLSSSIVSNHPKQQQQQQQQRKPLGKHKHKQTQDGTAKVAVQHRRSSAAATVAQISPDVAAGCTCVGCGSKSGGRPMEKCPKCCLWSCSAPCCSDVPAATNKGGRPKRQGAGLRWTCPNPSCGKAPAVQQSPHTCGSAKPAKAPSSDPARSNQHQEGYTQTRRGGAAAPSVSHRALVTHINKPAKAQARKEGPSAPEQDAHVAATAASAGGLPCAYFMPHAGSVMPLQHEQQLQHLDTDTSMLAVPQAATAADAGAAAAVGPRDSYFMPSVQHDKQLALGQCLDTDTSTPRQPTETEATRAYREFKQSLLELSRTCAELLSNSDETGEGQAAAHGEPVSAPAATTHGGYLVPAGDVDNSGGSALGAQENTAANWQQQMAGLQQPLHHQQLLLAQDAAQQQSAMVAAAVAAAAARAQLGL